MEATPPPMNDMNSTSLPEEAKTITVIGSLNYDLVSVTSRIPKAGETLKGISFHSGPGGKGGNQAVAAARLSRNNPRATSQSCENVGINVRMIGAVGEDEFGHRLVDRLSSDGINVSGVKFIENVSTGIAAITVETSNGENRIILNSGANDHVSPTAFSSCGLDSLGVRPDLIILQHEIPAATNLAILRMAREEKIPVLLNPAPGFVLPDEVYRGVTHLILNESEAEILSLRTPGQVSEPDFDWSIVGDFFLQKGVVNVVITLGPRGAFFASSTPIHHDSPDQPLPTRTVMRPGPPVTAPAGAGLVGEPVLTEQGYVPAAKVKRVVDTTAAGDTFVGAYAVGVVLGLPWIEDVVQAACKASAVTVESAGAQNSIPWMDEVWNLPNEVAWPHLRAEPPTST
ncbi:putative ribokinase [Diplocarpon rosae]|nr:putative ribokinase [Diplocarpon rosae]